MSLVRLLATVIAIAGLLGTATVPGLLTVDQTLAAASETLDEMGTLPEEFTPLAVRSRVLAADGSEIAILAGPENRITVPLDAVPEVTRNAVLAAEDSDFYEHHGVDHDAIIRALVANVAEGQVEQGGSTITQQYVKNALLTPDRTLERKLREAVTSTRLEAELTKDQILERYLNLAYFGNGVYGIATAAEYYFSKNIGDLDAPESALLAGLIRAPEGLDPTVVPERAREVRDAVLRMMGALGHLDAHEVDAAVATDLGLQLKPLPPPQHPFFLEYLKKLLLEHPALGETREERANVLFGGGLTIQTTLDPVLQGHAHAAITEYLADPVADPLAGIVSMQPGTGRIIAMAGGPKTFGDCAPGEDPCTKTKVNALVPGLGSSGRQVGSSFKPIVLAAALDAGIPTSWHTSTHSGQTIEDCGAPGQPWKPVNYGGGGGGTLDMVNAIRRSSNVYHAKLTAEIGPQTVVDMAGRLGIQTQLQPFCSLGLGAQDLFPLDMATAFATFAAEGVRCLPLAISEVRDRAGEVVIRNEPQCEEVLDPAIARQISTMLQNVVESGTGTGARIGRPVAGKTGTTNDWRDAWFVGYTPQLATAVWMGYEQPSPMRGILGHRTITGGSVPASMWSTFMSAALEGVEVLPLPDERLSRWVPPPPPPPPPGPPPPPPPGPPPGAGPPPPPEGGEGGGGGNDGGGSDEDSGGDEGGDEDDD